MTTRNCMNCRQEKGGLKMESSQVALTVHESEKTPACIMGDDRTATQLNPGAHPHKYPQHNPNNNKGSNLNSDQNLSRTRSSVNLVQHKPGCLGQHIKTQILVENTPLEAIRDSGANISAVHPSTLVECRILENRVRPWYFNPVK